MKDSAGSECAAVLGGISAYLDGELDSTECASIEHHCTSCPACAAVVAGLRETIGLCRGVAVDDLPPTVRQKAQESVAQLLGKGKA